MGVCSGGTMRDLAQTEVDICFSFEPKGTKKTIEQILNQRSPKNPILRKIMGEEADKMVAQKFLSYDENGQVHIFSKDSQGAYSYQPANIINRVMNRLLNFLPYLERRIKYSFGF